MRPGSSFVTDQRRVVLVPHSCAKVRAAVQIASSPYDAATAPDWLARLEGMMLP